MAAIVALFRSFFLLLLLMFFWKSASAVSDSEALLKLKESFNNAGGGALDSWTPGSVPCDEDEPWEGLICHNGSIVELRLQGMGLSGEIDVEALILLKDLRSFSVVNNSFDGNIPELNRLSYLKAMYLSINQFSGQIPADYFYGMGSLKKVWLSDNRFSGIIPISLSKVPRLIELHLENNQFSGKIPGFYHQHLQSINFSNNELEGEIPHSLSEFKGGSFSGNPGLCGAQIGVECEKEDDNVHGGSDTRDMKKIIAAAVVLSVMLLFLIIFFVIKWRKNAPETGNTIRNERSNENAEVQVTMPSAMPEVEVGRNSSTRNPTRNRRSSSNVPRAVPELVMINEEKGVFDLSSLMKASAQVLGDGALGSSYKTTLANGVSVVVKRTKEMNSLGKDEFDAVVKRLGLLKHPNVLTPLAYHYRNEEKLFVYEYFDDGSLLYQLHGDRRTLPVSGPDWPSRLKIVQGIAEGLGYIHAELASLDVPHGNLKSGNVLIGPDNHPFLAEYGFCSLVSIDGAEALFAYKAPEALQHGKACHKSDVYCLGIIILEILTGKFPSQYPDNGEGGTDVVEWVAMEISEGRRAEVFDPKIASGSNSLQEMEKLLHIGSLCTQTSLDERLDMKEAIKMIQEIRVADDDPESDPQARTTVQVLPSSQDEYVDAKSGSDTSSIREADV